VLSFSFLVLYFPPFADGEKMEQDTATTFKNYAYKSTVGYVPFNSQKQNQDRAIFHPTFAGSESKSFWGHFLSIHPLIAFVHVFLYNLQACWMGTEAMDTSCQSGSRKNFPETSQITHCWKKILLRQ